MPDRPRPISLLSVALAILFVAPLSARLGFAFDVTDCSQAVPDRAIGDLTGDITCTGNGGPRLGRGATLKLNGHAVIGSGANGEVGIYCRYRCRIEGPGEVRGFGGVGVFIDHRARCEVTNLDVHDNDLGLLGGRIVASSVTADSNRFGVFADRFRGTDVSISSNHQIGFAGGAIVGENITASNNGEEGLTTNRYRLTGLVAQNNGRVGLHAELPGQGSLKDSNVTGNAGGLFDLSTARKPRLRNTTCGKSQRIGGGGGSWGVCSGD